MNSSATVLLFHGSPNPGAMLEAQRLADGISRKGLPHATVKTAFLQFSEPRLEEVLQEMVQAGVSSIRVFPLLVFRGNHLEKDVEPLLKRFQGQFPDRRFVLLPHLAAIPDFGCWLASFLLGQEALGSGSGALEPRVPQSLPGQE